MCDHSDGLSYGNALANAAGVVILAVGIFAALNQVEIAPAIVNGLFYALLAIIAGSAIVAIGGSGIVPLRSYWERALQRLDEESSRIREESQGRVTRSAAGQSSGVCRPTRIRRIDRLVAPPRSTRTVHGVRATAAPGTSQAPMGVMRRPARGADARPPAEENAVHARWSNRRNNDDNDDS